VSSETAAFAAAHDPDAEAAARRDWLLLAGATVAFGVGFGINVGSVSNFAVHSLHIEPQRLGLLESLREVPGLLTAAMIGVVGALALPRLALFALLLVGLGFGATGQAGGFWPLVACNVLWSIGLHVWLTVQPTLTLTLARAGHHGHGLGLMSRYQSVAMMAGLLIVWFFGARIGFGPLFLIAGGAAAAGALFAARITSARGGGGLTQRLVFRREYWRYYGLMLLDGGRRQVVQTFALLILVREFNAPLRTVAVLLLLNSLLTMAAAPLVGRWTDRFGERRVLSIYYGLVAVVFFAYTRITGVAAATGLPALGLFCGVFALDNLLFTGSVGIQTYIRHTAPAEELSPSLAMGLTWNHIAAVTVPLAAGQIWERYGYERIFMCGIVLAVLSLLMCQTLPRHEPGTVS